MTAIKTMKEWALHYAGLGLAVFPLKVQEKVPATANGCKAATKNIQEIEQWWNANPSYNIGIATGETSGGLFAIDLDIDEEKGKNGYEVLKEWQREHSKLPETWQSITGRGGYHIFYRDASVVRNRTNLYDGVDIRGDGGYIVAPPSIHPNGRLYEWEYDPDTYRLADASDLVFDFINGVPESSTNYSQFTVSAIVPEGERTSTMVKLVCSLQSKGLDDLAIRAAVSVENDAKCNPPLTEQELEKEVFPALKRYEKGTSSYIKGKGSKTLNTAGHLEMVTMDRAVEKAAEWLITDYLPAYQITTLAGDGGAGKTTVWCAIAAAVSSGNPSFLVEDMLPPEFAQCEPRKVMFFSAEDSFEYTLKRRLRLNGAKLENIMSIDVADERFKDIKFGSPFLESLIAKYRPDLIIFDPIQAFVPPDIRMGDRNAMRANLSPLIGYGERYSATSLIVVHANKQSAVWGRKRIADSADIWDISRSVIMAGETNEKGVRYLSHEKCNYSMTGETVLYSIEGEKVVFKGYTQKKDKDFITEVDYTTRQAPQREEAKDFIIDFLKDGEQEVCDLDEMAKVQGFSKGTLTRAKADLKKEGRIKYRSTGQGNYKKHYVSIAAD